LLKQLSTGFEVPWISNYVERLMGGGPVERCLVDGGSVWAIEKPRHSFSTAYLVGHITVPGLTRKRNG